MQQLLFINNPLAQNVSGIIMPIFRTARPYITAYGVPCALCAHGLLPGFPRHQPAHQELITVCSNIRSRAPEDGHNDARNMLS